MGAQTTTRIVQLTLSTGAVVAAVAVAGALIVGLISTRNPQLADREPVVAAGSAPRGPGLPLCSTALIEPETFPERCGDDTRFWQNVRWTSWTARSAFGVGEYWVRDENGAGTFQSFPVRLQLAGAAGSGSHATFSRLVMTFSAQSPDSARGHRVTYQAAADGFDVVQEDL